MGVTIAMPDLAIRLATIKECVLLLTCYVVSRAIHYFVVKPLTSPLRKLQRPPEGKGFLGHWPDMMDYYNGTTIDKWVQDYGPTFMVRGPYYVHHRLFTMDARAVSHIMANPYSYEKPWILRQVLKRYMSEGLVVAEGHRHKVQRKIVQRLFSRNTMRQMNEVVVEKANQFRDVFTDLINSSEPIHPIISHHAAPKDGIVVDMYSAASRVTYDIIGQVAIDHTFDTLGQPHGEGGELFDKYEKMQQMVPGSGGYRQEIGVVLPWIDKIAPTENSRRVDAAMGPLEALSRAKIAERRKEVAEGKRSDARDLLSLMVRANMSNDVAPDWKMYDSEISGQLATFVFAGSDTTAGAIAWGLFALARHPEVQQQLRTECLSYGENLPFEQMDELPFLNATVKEILRMSPSFPNTIRIARKDDIIPLTTPIVDVDGKTLNEVRIRKGQIVHLPIEDLNMSASLWGPDAREFRPSRWLDLSKSHTSTTKDPNDMKNTTSFNGDPNAGPGVWPNIMTFIDGPRRCVGYKLALMECKILLFTLVRSFTFEPVEGVRIGKWNLFSTRPYVVGELANTGTSLPLVVKAYKG